MSDTDAVRAEQVPDQRPGLSGEQDARLRTLAALQEHGQLSTELQRLSQAFRERDQRADVRPPAVVVWPAVEEPDDPA